MRDSGRVFLAAICFSALFCRIPAGGGKLLEEAVDVVDDLYGGCREQAVQRFIRSGLLKQELNDSVGFRRAWDSNPPCNMSNSEGKTEHMHGLSAYLDRAGELSKTFDREVETMGANVSTYENNFHFKSLHFLLMDTMSVQKAENCQTVFIFVEEDEPKIPVKGATVRFGSFTQGFPHLQGLDTHGDIDGRVILNVTSCFFAELRDGVCRTNKHMLLLSPAEEFTVEGVNKRNHLESESDYTEVVLKHLQLNSTHNCWAFSRSPAAVSTLWLVFALLIFSVLYLPV